MLLAQAVKNLLTCLFIYLKFNCGIFFNKTVDACDDLFFLTFFADINCHSKARSREINAVKRYNVFGIAHCVARLKARKLCNNADIARRDKRYVLLL